MNQSAAAQDVPDMMSECPICLEPLFDEQGIACNGDIAKMMCYHLVHSDCLSKAGQQLNSDGRRYGIGGLGPRAGCPVCNRPVSMWMCYDEAAAFPLFWINQILGILSVIGSSSGPVKVSKVRSMLMADKTLTKRQKEFISQQTFKDALSEGMRTFYWEEVNGGIRNGGREEMGCRDNVWYWNKQAKTLWLYKWGEVPNRMASPPRVGYAVRNQNQNHQLERPISGNVTLFIVAIAAAILASIYFDDGSEITW